MNSKSPHIAEMWRPTGSVGAVECGLCFRACIIAPGKRGMCQARENRFGTLISLNYGYTKALALDPVEKKPLYHFQPGSMTFSIGAPGCNFTCLGCQNHNLSRPGLDWPAVAASEGIVETLAGVALEQRADSWSFTYSEPTVFFEYAQDLGRQAISQGLPVIWVTNGSMSKEVIETIKVSAMNIDLKSFSDSFYKTVAGGRLSVVAENIERALARDIWVEITTLLIGGLNDSDQELEKLTKYLAGLSLDIPWHVSRFFPHHLQNHIPATPVASLLKAREIGRKNGLRHIYLGNARGQGFSDTICPSCGELLISREGYQINIDRLSSSGECSSCRTPIP
ncbi:MAG: AmmeMemoRadiSam system radical SAM enzyme, partial [Deltaproteobacteria bacterium]|nr:AmmeMemoRadiSam system radical SAM enzyme [Deltaproteobacteria bacterium]